MTSALEELNSISESEAAAAFRACCGSSRWVEEMVSLRPFNSMDSLMAAADTAWNTTGPDDWREAFGHHPRVGESIADSSASRAGQWSDAEQAGVRSASTAARDELAEVNRAYEARFGHIYIVCAMGKSVEQMLDLARRRLDNAPAVELRIAAEEQRKIMHIRLRRLLGEKT